jgi:hypothetical protein
MAMGVFSKLSSRLRAVTTISINWSLGALTPAS